MPLTVREKEHWKQRIEKKIDKAVEEIYRKEGKELKKTLRQEAEERAVKRLGLQSYMEKYQTLQDRKSALKEQLSKLSDEAAKPFEAEGNQSRYYHQGGHSLIESVVQRERVEAEKEILLESDAGRKVLRLEREREELADTIWLATSPVQIRSLWKDFTALVTEEPTDLQKQAMTYEPAESE